MLALIAVLRKRIYAEPGIKKILTGNFFRLLRAPTRS